MELVIAAAGGFGGEPLKSTYYQACSSAYYCILVLATAIRLNSSTSEQQ